MPLAEAFAARTRFARRQRGLSDAVESRLRRRDGTPIDVLIASSPIFDEHLAFSGALAMISDITDLKRAEAAMELSARDRDRLVVTLETERQRLREQFAKLPVPTFLWEQDGGDFVLLDLNEGRAPGASASRR